MTKLRVIKCRRRDVFALSLLLFCMLTRRKLVTVVSDVVHPDNDVTTGTETRIRTKTDSGTEQNFLTFLWSACETICPQVLFCICNQPIQLMREGSEALSKSLVRF